MPPEDKGFHQNWLAQQRADLEELSEALLHDAHDENKLRLLIRKSLEHFESYTLHRLKLSEEDAPSLFCPVWCTSYENSFLWIGGCRPSFFIRLAYTLSGSQLEAQLEEYLSGVRRGNLAELSYVQLSQVNDLHVRTVREEDKLSSRLASLQENIVDEPLVSFAADSSGSSSLNEVDGTMNAHASAMGKIIEDADKLRLSTLTKLLDIFTPRQSLDFLIASKQLHLSINVWGKRRASCHGKIAT
ncbi:protein DOG1-like 3 [Aristolochia californica]|uniref:protein DOG1-like 3 n=1 Tax=Aristolochia californica TaxID=171875 RepID=UPI0035D8FEE5